MIFAALQSVALEGAEKIVNATLVHDPASAERLRALEGKVLLVDSSMPPLRIAVEPSATGLMLHSNWQDDADVTVTGTLVSLVAMAINSGEMVSLSGTGVNVSGNLEVLRQLNHILAGLDVDWEAALAELIGDVPAHLLGETIRNSAEFRGQAVKRAQSALAEVSQEEVRLAPSKNEYEGFVQSVRHLSTDVDRLAVRANKLRLSLQEGKISQ
ncbi:SCP2 sterol-binding domain-containing protein [Porticoccaceae bacterium]|nr:SCP2 sterol-binding domain-containing protein [Porticoccaceae bacterium]